MRIFAAILCLLLSGCTWDAPPPIDVQVHCLPMREYNAAQQAALASEWAKIDPLSVTMSLFIPDSIRMRDANRACAAPKSGK